MNQQTNEINIVSPNALRLMLSLFMAWMTFASGFYVTAGLLMVTAVWYTKQVIGDVE